MYKKRGYKTIIGVLLPLLTLCCFTGCFISDKRSRLPGTPYLHKGYEEYEAVIYNDLQDYIRLGEPRYDSEQSIISIEVSFLEWYCESEDAMSEHPMYEVIDRFIYLFNDFLRENPDYFNVDGVRYYICFGYQTFSHFERVAELSSFTSKIQSDYLCALECWESVDYAKLTCKDDIEYVFLNSQRKGIEDDYEYASYVCDVISLFPNLKEVNFSASPYDRETVIEIIHETYPDIIVG